MFSLLHRRSRHIALIALATSGLAACASVRPGCPVTGDPETIARLAGDWHGTYKAEDGSEGRISFRLDAGTDTARGEVFIAPRTMVPITDADRAPNAFHASSLALIPAVRFIEASGGELVGTLEPYQDPECGCVMRTSFRGRLAGNTIEGTFTSEGSGFFHMPSRGTWKVVRVAEHP
jgi:hypothetical protein